MKYFSNSYGSPSHKFFADIDAFFSFVLSSRYYKFPSSYTMSQGRDPFKKYTNKYPSDSKSSRLDVSILSNKLLLPMWEWMLLNLTLFLGDWVYFDMKMWLFSSSTNFLQLPKSTTKILSAFLPRPTKKLDESISL